MNRISLLFVFISIFSVSSFAQNNVGIGTTTPTHQLHTTQGVRHQGLSGSGARIVYADSSGVLKTPDLVTIAADSNTSSQTITDMSCTPAMSSITISGWPTNMNPQDIAVRLNIQHNDISEVIAVLVNPVNDTMILFAGMLGSTTSASPRFTDYATDNFANSTAPFNADYLTYGVTGGFCTINSNVATFSAMNANSGSIDPNGTWTVLVFDQADFISNTNGTLLSWTLENYTPAIPSLSADANYIPRFTSLGLVKSSMYQSGTNIGINTNNPAFNLQVNGAGVFASQTSAIRGQNNDNSDYSVPGTMYSEGRIADFDGITFFPNKDAGVWGNAYNDWGTGVDGYGGVFTSSSSLGVQDKLVVLGGTLTNPAGAFLGGNVGIGLLTPQHPLTVAESNPLDTQPVSLRGYSNTPMYWKGGAAFGYSGASVIMGEVSGVAQIGGHNADLSAWANLAINSGGGNVGIGTTTPSEKLEINGNTKTSNLEVVGNTVTNNLTATNATISTSTETTANIGTANIGTANISTNLTFSGSTPGSGKVLTSDAIGNATWQNPSGGITGSGTASGSTSYIPRFASPTSLTNSLIQQNVSNNGLGINSAPLVQSLLYLYRQQLTVNGDAQTTLYGYRTRDSQNDGTGYGQSFSNDATRGYNFWGDVYTFGVAGFNYNDYTRCGGTLGAEQSGAYWGSLGYKSSASLTYGVYGSTAYASGTGLLPDQESNGIGGGFFGTIGSVSKGSVAGQLNEGELFAVYNKGDVYTSGKSVELVSVSEENIVPTYAVTSAELSVYNKGKISLVNGEAQVLFSQAYSSILGETPVVTASPMGNCNGVYISEVTKTGFTIKELNNGSSTVEIAWIAVGNRIDASSDGVPAMLSNKNFNRNLSEALFNDSDTKHTGKGMWWDGTQLQFGTMPAKFSISEETIQQKKEIDKQMEAQRKKDMGLE